MRDLRSGEEIFVHYGYKVRKIVVNHNFSSSFSKSSDFPILSIESHFRFLLYLNGSKSNGSSTSGMRWRTFDLGRRNMRKEVQNNRAHQGPAGLCKEIFEGFVSSVRSSQSDNKISLPQKKVTIYPQLFNTGSLVNGPSGRLDFVLRALRMLRPCDPRNGELLLFF